MREDCKHYESRTYQTGDTVRKCKVDLAPDAPWRCPDACTAYERRLVGGEWSAGSLASTPPPPEPEGLEDGSAAAVLDAAEDVLNSVGPEVLAEVSVEDAHRERRGVLGWFRARRRGRER